MNYQKLARNLASYFAPVEGTWTPTYLGGTTPGTTTYTVQVGHYTRIGNICAFSLRVAWTAASGTGNAQISLPFTVRNVTNYSAVFAAYTINVTFAASGVQAIANANTAFAVLNSPTSNAGSSIVQVEAAGTIILSGVYDIESV
jgi:hypothetical protein